MQVPNYKLTNTANSAPLPREKNHPLSLLLHLTDTNWFVEDSSVCGSQPRHLTSSWGQSPRASCALVTLVTLARWPPHHPSVGETAWLFCLWGWNSFTQPSRALNLLPCLVQQPSAVLGSKHLPLPQSGHDGQGWLLCWEREKRGWRLLVSSSAAPLARVPHGKAVPPFLMAWF